MFSRSQSRMDLLEYQAKELFRQVGIPTLPSQTIYNARELKQLQVPYPVVLKSQVRAGGRGKAGGIRFVANTIDAIAAARTIFSLSILGEYPQVILAEARYDTEQEFFLAVVLDYQLQRPILLGSARGGMNIEPLLENLQRVVVESEFSPFYARRLAVRMGLSGDLIQSVSTVIEKMYRLFEAQDLDLIEINPLGVNSQGELMALDGKITANDLALARHLDILALTKDDNYLNLPTQKQPTEAPIDLTASINSPQWLNWREEKGTIAVICNSWDLGLVTWDLLGQGKGKPACCVIIDPQQTLEVASVSWQEQLSQVLAEIEIVPGIKVVLINVLADSEINAAIAQTINQYYQPIKEQNEEDAGAEKTSVVAKVTKSRSHSQASNQTNARQKQIPSVKMIVRLLEQQSPDFSQDLPKNLLYWTNNLEEAVQKAISWGKSR